MSDLKQMLDDAVDWYEPDRDVLLEGARRRSAGRANRRRFAAIATSLVVFALGAIVVWGAFRSPAPIAGIPDATGGTGQDAEHDTGAVAGTRITVATGDDPAAGAWELWITVKDQGVGTHLSDDSGDSGGCCSRGPITDGAMWPDSAGWLKGSGGHVMAWVTDAVDHVVFEAASGARLDGSIYPIPGRPAGFTHMALVFVPDEIVVDGEFAGDLVAYGESGEEIDRYHVGAPLGAPGPTAEVDRVWTMLRRHAT
jgi:hypothetical protein